MLRRYLLLIFFVYSSAVIAEERTMLILGDSLSAGYGMSLEESWVSQLEKRLKQQDYNYKIINASITGETTRGAVSRLPAILAEHPVDITIVELGGNDGLRGIPLKEIESNLLNIIKALQASNCVVVLVQMQLPPNYGPAYISKFKDIYTRLAESHNAHLTRFVMEDMIKDPNLMQEDQIHPTAAAQHVMLDNVWGDIEPLLKKGIE